MPKEVSDFIRSQFLSVLATEMLDGSPHAATVHFAFRDGPPLFLFETCRSYRKAEGLLKRPESRATVVIGFDENNRKSLQMDGMVRLLRTDTELLMFKKAYLERFPKKKKTFEDPEFIFFSFTPSWWRYTDWDAPSGKIVLSSESGE